MEDTHSRDLEHAEVFRELKLSRGQCPQCAWSGLGTSKITVDNDRWQCLSMPKHQGAVTKEGSKP